MALTRTDWISKNMARRTRDTSGVHATANERDLMVGGVRFCRVSNKYESSVATARNRSKISKNQSRIHLAWIIIDFNANKGKFKQLDF